MKVNELIKNIDFEILSMPNENASVESVYCCDFLSWAMTRAKENCAWVTVIANFNTLAVCSLCNVSLLVIADDAPVVDGFIEKANEKNINVVKSKINVFDSALMIYNTIR
ncbi:MAG: hypothetical protein Q4F88_00285 [Eubacteriales bacterium]|nr:hypothetical protein [Eubacteriales bacterium]